MKIKDQADLFFLILLLFLAIFCSVLLRVNRKVLTAENRKVSELPPLFVEGELNGQFSNEMEAYLMDHFVAKEKICKIRHSISFLIDQLPTIGNYVYDKHSKWILPLESLLGDPLVTESQCENAYRCLHILRDYCEENGIKLYVVVVPDRGSYYGDRIRYLSQARNLDENAYFRRTLEKLTYVIYPKNELLDASKNDYVYFKTDHHWTDIGAFAGYQALIDRVRLDFPEVYKATMDDFLIKYDNFVRSDFNRSFFAGHNFLRMNAWYNEDKLLSDDYKYMDPKRERKVRVDNERMQKDFFCGRGKYRVMLTGTSMSENLLQILPESFSEIRYRRLNVPRNNNLCFLRRFGEELKEYSPDMLILCLTYGNLRNAHQLIEK